MNVENMKSVLRMESLYFSKCSITRGAEVRNGEICSNLERKVTKISDHVYEVVLLLTMEHPDFKLSIEANAIFTYEADGDSQEETVVNCNTVAIMFPFIRSQVTLLTSQPGMTPVVLQPINATNFV